MVSKPWRASTVIGWPSGFIVFSFRSILAVVLWVEEDFAHWNQRLLSLHHQGSQLCPYQMLLDQQHGECRGPQVTCLITLDKVFSFQPRPTEEERKWREGGKEGKRGPYRYRTDFICWFFSKDGLLVVQVASGGHKIQLHICSAFPLHCDDLCAGDV